MRKRVRFLSTEQFESEGRGKGPIFEAGKEYEFDGPFADRWIKREVAELIEEIPEPPFNQAGLEGLMREADGLVTQLSAARGDLQRAILGE